MSNIRVRLDDELAENIVLAAQVSSCIVLVGQRQFDRFMLAKPEGTPRILSLERLCHESIAARATWVFEPARGNALLAYMNGEAKIKTALPTELNNKKGLKLIEAITAFAELKPADNETRFALVVNAGLMIVDPAGPRDEDFTLIRAIEHLARESDRSHVLFLRVPRATSLPAAILTAPQVRTVHINAASRDVRYTYSKVRCQGLAERCGVEPSSVAQTLSSATEDWTLNQIDALVQTAERQDIMEQQDIEEMARAVRIGTTHSPWAGERIRAAVKGAREELSKRVIGQPKAVDSVVTSLRRAVTGLSHAHKSQGSQAPRAIFFFAGPTGTGKTELAKAVSQLVFGQEQLLRFDCGELRQEHAVARLIGAPPGYVGYDQGGELTEGVRSKPNSVVLFDEIEKAHPRLLDTLLGVLDDGRLTSGQGETAYFGQAILIFTSNLGMYEEVASGNGRMTRRPLFNYDTPFDMIEREVRSSIREEFVTRLGRPELLGRFGGAESVTVFDYLRDLERVCRKFVSNIAARVKRLHGVELVVDDKVIKRVVSLIQSRPDALVLGGRGLALELDRVLTNPLSDYLFDEPVRDRTLHVSLDSDRTVFLNP